MYTVQRPEKHYARLVPTSAGSRIKQIRFRKRVEALGEGYFQSLPDVDTLEVVQDDLSWSYYLLTTSGQQSETVGTFASAGDAIVAALAHFL